MNTISDRDQAPAIVRGLLDLGRTLELELVAQGIELDHQLDHLKQEHCELGQGYLFARPLTPTDAEVFFDELTDPDNRQQAVSAPDVARTTPRN